MRGTTSGFILARSKFKLGSRIKMMRSVASRNVSLQSPLTIWFTGLSGSGKSTLALALEQRFLAEGLSCYVLDGDKVRQGLNRDLGFSTVDRSENIRRVAEVSRLMNDAGLIVIAAFISPYRSDREMAREIIGKERFFEIHLSTPIETCEQRDVKSLYNKARAGKIKDFTGVSAPYESPLKPLISIDTSLVSIEDSLMQLYKILIKGTIEVKESLIKS